MEHPMSSVDRAFQILFLLAESPEELGVTEIGRRLGLSKSTVFRFLASMEKLGIVQKNSHTSKYHLGLTLFELGNRVFIKKNIIDRFHPYLEELAYQVREIVNLAGLFQNELIYLDKIEANRSLRIRTYVGFHIYPHCTALGKAILAHMNGADVKRILKEEGLPARTEKTITDPEKLFQELEKIRQEGFALDDEEFEYGLRCLAVPVFDSQKRVVASISISAPAVKITQKTLPDYVNKLRRTAQALERELQLGTEHGAYGRLGSQKD